MTLSHTVQFEFILGLSRPAAIAFVRDVTTSLSKATFIEDLEVEAGHPPTVFASLPVNAALFGQQTLNFKSSLVHTPTGARLEPLTLETDKPGWAEVAGEATLQPDPKGTRVNYSFDITIHLKLPKAEKWGGRALTRMIEFTAQRVLENISANFPEAVQAAAQEVEKKFAT